MYEQSCGLLMSEQCCWGLQISQGLAGRTGSLATIGKALVHIFNWEGDWKTEDNTDPLSH